MGAYLFYEFRQAYCIRMRPEIDTLIEEVPARGCFSAKEMTYLILAGIYNFSQDFSFFLLKYSHHRQKCTKPCPTVTFLESSPGPHRFPTLVSKPVV